MGAALHARDAFEIETMPVTDVDEPFQTRHRSCVVSAILQSTAALEDEVWEVMVYGPGHHLGSNGTDVAAQDFLRPMADLVDRLSTVERFQTVLHLLGKAEIDRGGQAFEDASLAIRLRNEIVHHKSRLGVELDRKDLFVKMKYKAHARPPFRSAYGMNFFPHHCLSAECAEWAVNSCVLFLGAFYSQLGVAAPVDAKDARLRARP
jgi:hypothetical protein